MLALVAGAAGELGHALDGGRAGKHPGLDRRDREVLHHGAHLGLEEPRVHGEHVADAERVLGRDGGNRAGPVHLERRERAQVGLDAGTSAGVGPGDGEGDDWFHAVNPTDVAAGVSTLGPWENSFRSDRSALRHGS